MWHVLEEHTAAGMEATTTAVTSRDLGSTYLLLLWGKWGSEVNGILRGPRLSVSLENREGWGNLRIAAALARRAKVGHPSITVSALSRDTGSGEGF